MGESVASNSGVGAALVEGLKAGAVSVIDGDSLGDSPVISL